MNQTVYHCRSPLAWGHGNVWGAEEETHKWSLHILLADPKERIGLQNTHLRPETATHKMSSSRMSLLKKQNFHLYWSLIKSLFQLIVLQFVCLNKGFHSSTKCKVESQDTKEKRRTSRTASTRMSIRFWNTKAICIRISYFHWLSIKGSTWSFIEIYLW